MTIEDLALSIQKDFLAIREEMVAKSDLAALRAQMATREKPKPYGTFPVAFSNSCRLCHLIVPSVAMNGPEHAGARSWYPRTGM